MLSAQSVAMLQNFYFGRQAIPMDRQKQAGVHRCIVLVGTVPSAGLASGARIALTERFEADQPGGFLTGRGDTRATLGNMFGFALDPTIAADAVDVDALVHSASLIINGRGTASPDAVMPLSEVLRGVVGQVSRGIAATTLTQPAVTTGSSDAVAAPVTALTAPSINGTPALAGRPTFRTPGLPWLGGVNSDLFIQTNSAIGALALGADMHFALMVWGTFHPGQDVNSLDNQAVIVGATPAAAAACGR